MNNGKQLDKIEAMLEPLIAQHGIETVNEHLRVLFGNASVSSYFTVFAVARNVANRLERRKAHVR